MRGMRAGMMVVAAILALSGFAALPWAQQSGNPTGRPPIYPNGPPPLGLELSPGQREKQDKLQNDARQKQLVADADRLLQLATELHADVGKTDRNVLSLDVIKKADEIEKLAHSVKAKMRG